MTLYRILKFRETPRRAPRQKQVAGMSEEEVESMKWSILSAEQLDQQFTKNDLVQILNHLGIEHDKRQVKPELIGLLKRYG